MSSPHEGGTVLESMADGNKNKNKNRNSTNMMYPRAGPHQEAQSPPNAAAYTSDDTSLDASCVPSPTSDDRARSSAHVSADAARSLASRSCAPGEVYEDDSSSGSSGERASVAAESSVQVVDGHAASDDAPSELESLKIKLAGLFQHVAHAYIYLDRCGSSDTLKISDVRRTFKNMYIQEESRIDKAIDEALGPLWKSDVIDVKQFIRKLAWHPIVDLAQALEFYEQSKLLAPKIQADVAQRLAALQELRKKRTEDLDGVLAHVCEVLERNWISVSLAYTRFTPPPPEGLPRGVLARMLRGNRTSPPMAWQRKAMDETQFRAAMEEHDIRFSAVQVCRALGMSRNSILENQRVTYKHTYMASC
jgi:hypothetical protein